MAHSTCGAHVAIWGRNTEEAIGASVSALVEVVKNKAVGARNALSRGGSNALLACVVTVSALACERKFANWALVEASTFAEVEAIGTARAFIDTRSTASSAGWVTGSTTSAFLSIVSSTLTLEVLMGKAVLLAGAIGTPAVGKWRRGADLEFGGSAQGGFKAGELIVLGLELRLSIAKLALSVGLGGRRNRFVLPGHTSSNWLTEFLRVTSEVLERVGRARSADTVSVGIGSADLAFAGAAETDRHALGGIGIISEGLARHTWDTVAVRRCCRLGGLLSTRSTVVDTKANGLCSRKGIECVLLARDADTIC